MELTYAELSSPGPARENNEDFVGFWQPETLEEKRSHGAVGVLADGVGGLGPWRSGQPSGGGNRPEDVSRGPGGTDPAAAAHPDVQRGQPGGLRQRHGEPWQVPHGHHPGHRRFPQQRNCGGQCGGFAGLSGPQGRDQAIVHGPYLRRHAAEVRADFRAGRQDQRKPFDPDPQRRPGAGDPGRRGEYNGLQG